jgi:tetratricopeptide (TPR) repeat protein
MNRNTVSLCLIARDEEATIGMAIKSILALVDEVIVADTGSTDNTRIIAEGYGAKVIDVPWEDDFSAARNAALDQATCDWILVLDADEFLQPVRPIEFQRLLQNPRAAGYRLRMISPRREDVGPNAYRIRLFRNVPRVRYRYPIHERISPALTDWAASHRLKILDSGLTLVHEGNGTEKSLRKRERNLRILRSAVDAYPEEPYFPYRLACAGVTMLDEEVLPVAGLGAALGLMHASWIRARGYPTAAQRNLPWLPDLGIRMAGSLLTLDRLDEARKIIDEVRGVFPDHPAVLRQSAAVVCRLLDGDALDGRSREAATMFSRAQDDLGRILASTVISPSAAVDRRILDLYPLRYLGELALLRGRVAEAVGLFEKALSLDPAYSFGWLGMAECSRYAGDRKRALKLYLRTVTENELNYRAWLRGCDLMREMDFHDNAASWWVKVADRFPELPAVAVTKGGLAEAPAAEPVHV